MTQTETTTGIIDASYLSCIDILAPDTVAMLEAERRQAVDDLLAHNIFKPNTNISGPYSLRLSIQEGRLVFEMRGENNAALPVLLLSLKPYARLISDYFMMVEAYESKRLTCNPCQLQAVDMGRRGVHDEAATLLRERLAGKVEIDHETARRLFTLICVLHLGTARNLAFPV